MRSRPPIWLMGMCNLPIGIGGAIALVTTPQLLAGLRVPEAAIAGVTTTMLISVFTGFLFAPILDWRFSRRTYAFALAARWRRSGVLQTSRLATTPVTLVRSGKPTFAFPSKFRAIHGSVRRRPCRQTGS